MFSGRKLLMLRKDYTNFGLNNSKKRIAIGEINLRISAVIWMCLEKCDKI